MNHFELKKKFSLPDYILNSNGVQCLVSTIIFLNTHLQQINIGPLPHLQSQTDLCDGKVTCGLICEYLQSNSYSFDEGGKYIPRSMLQITKDPVSFCCCFPYILALGPGLSALFHNNQRATYTAQIAILSPCLVFYHIIPLLPANANERNKNENNPIKLFNTYGYSLTSPGNTF